MLSQQLMQGAAEPRIQKDSELIASAKSIKSGSPEMTGEGLSETFSDVFFAETKDAKLRVKETPSARAAQIRTTSSAETFAKRDALSERGSQKIEQPMAVKGDAPTKAKDSSETIKERAPGKDASVVNGKSTDKSVQPSETSSLERVVKKESIQSKDYKQQTSKTDAVPVDAQVAVRTPAVLPHYLLSPFNPIVFDASEMVDSTLMGLQTEAQEIPTAAVNSDIQLHTYLARDAKSGLRSVTQIESPGFFAMDMQTISHASLMGENGIIPVQQQQIQRGGLAESVTSDAAIDPLFRASAANLPASNLVSMDTSVGNSLQHLSDANTPVMNPLSAGVQARYGNSYDYTILPQADENSGLAESEWLGVGAPKMFAAKGNILTQGAQEIDDPNAVTGLQVSDVAGELNSVIHGDVAGNAIWQGESRESNLLNETPTQADIVRENEMGQMTSTRSDVLLNNKASAGLTNAKRDMQNLVQDAGKKLPGLATDIAVSNLDNPALQQGDMVAENVVTPIMRGGAVHINTDARAPISDFEFFQDDALLIDGASSQVHSQPRAHAQEGVVDGSEMDGSVIADFGEPKIKIVGLTQGNVDVSAMQAMAQTAITVSTRTVDSAGSIDVSTNTQALPQPQSAHVQSELLQDAGLADKFMFDIADDTRMNMATTKYADEKDIFISSRSMNHLLKTGVMPEGVDQPIVMQTTHIAQNQPLLQTSILLSQHVIEPKSGTVHAEGQSVLGGGSEVIFSTDSASNSFMNQGGQQQKGGSFLGDQHAQDIQTTSTQSFGKTAVMQQILSDFKNQIQQQNLLRSAKNVNITVPIEHASLGKLNIQLDVKDGKVATRFYGEKKEMRSLLSQNKQSIIDALLEAGLDLDANPIHIIDDADQF